MEEVSEIMVITVRWKLSIAGTASLVIRILQYVIAKHHGQDP